MSNIWRHPTAAQLKERISGSKKAGKINVFDPAAAPLGTDEEAAGTSPPGRSVEHAVDREAAREGDDHHPISAQPGRGWRPYPIYIVGTVIVLIFLVSLAAARF